MDFERLLDQSIEMLQRRGRFTYRTLQRQFNLDDETLEDLKEELLYSHPLVVDDKGRGLIWTGATETIPVTTSQSVEREPQLTIEPTQPAHVETPSGELGVSDVERYQLTVVFCDLVRSTDLSGQLDPEELRDVIQSYQTATTEVIQRFGGHVARRLGDGLLIDFRYSVAHEDDAQRAVRTGLGIIDAMQTLNQQLAQSHGIQLAVRIGIHTGSVVIGDIGAGEREEPLALEETRNVATSIQGLAESNTLIISDATYRLIQRDLNCESLGEYDLRGASQPIVLYRVLDSSGAQNELDVASGRRLTPFVGRESESALLFERWEQAKHNRGQVILLSGEAGIGKSRLVHALKGHVANEPYTRWECRSSPYYTNSALYPVIDLVQRTLRWQPGDTPERKLEKLEQNLRQYRLPFEETIPLFCALLSLPTPKGYNPYLVLSPQHQRQKTLEAIVAIILERAEHQPVLFILENLHWVDPTTVELLELLIDQTSTVSLYILLTCRPEFHPTWSHRSYLTEVTVKRLLQPQIVQMATHVSGGKILPAEVMQQLIARTDGVPLYVEEMTRAILESGHLKEAGDHYELIDSLSSLPIPSPFQDPFLARLDYLLTTKAIAQCASVIGRQFSFELLQTISGLNEVILDKELEKLVETEFIYQRGVPPQSTYVFKHSLIQDTAYESLLPSVRQGYHRRIAAVLAERFLETAESQPELLAYHYTQAGLYQEAVEFWKQAGERAIEHAANVEAIGHYTKALEVLRALL